MTEKITLITSDKVRISGNHFQVPIPSPGISLFHMMPATKESFSNFTKKLNANKIGVLAIDLRGHGESAGGNFLSFTDQQHQASIEDVRTAIHFQEKEGHSPLFVCGASIGANLSLQIIAEDHRVKKAILLSPGLNYGGLETLPLAQKVATDKEIYIVAAEDDGRKLGTCAEQGQKIYSLLNCKKKIKIFKTGGHGTDILEAHPELMEELIKWLKK